MTQCPICQHIFPQSLPSFCPQCGWDFQHDPTLRDSRENISPEVFNVYQQRKNIVRGIWEERLLLKTKYQDMQAELYRLRTECENWSEMHISDNREEADSTKHFEIEMVFIKGGRFMMGSNVKEDEIPIHEVELDDFYLGKYQVTQAQWKTVMGNNPSKLHFHADLPVEWPPQPSTLQRSCARIHRCQVRRQGPSALEEQQGHPLQSAQCSVPQAASVTNLVQWIHQAGLSLEETYVRRNRARSAASVLGGAIWTSSLCDDRPIGPAYPRHTAGRAANAH